MRVLCIADSLGLPSHKVSYESTWFSMLKKNFIEDDFISFFQRGITTDILNQLGGRIDGYPAGADLLEFYEPNVIIIQLGIVDCVPRLFLKSGIEAILLNKLMSKSVRTNYIKFIKRIRNRKINKVYVNIFDFKRNVIQYLKRCESLGVDKVIFIAIPVPSTEYLIDNPQAIENIERYNDVLGKLRDSFPFFNLISPLEPSQFDKPIYHDGYHPNSVGNECVFKELKMLLSNRKDSL